MRSCWVVGPIAWDWPYRLPRLPVSGEFVQGQRLLDRPGGTGANVARGLASRGVRVAMVGYVGDDEWAERSRSDLVEWGVDVSHVVPTRGETSQVLIMIEPSGERTIVGMVRDDLTHVRLSAADVRPGDVVYFAAWRDAFAPVVRELTNAGALVTSVPFAPQREPLPVAWIIGSVAEAPESARAEAWAHYRKWTGGRLECLILTQGSKGAQRVDATGEAFHPAPQVDAVDSTGAGDAFAAGILTGIMERRPISSAVEEAVLWAAAAVGVEASVPPRWDDVRAT